ncbi:hypothetical protein [Lentzea aerocolonigenes]|uniref:hypothetical protein n=1 Tax=Lentzea aerocolonigenes TaxID=68170 RepID=UPI001E55A22A|nr:hypothetical protein [Lentzea aerocolonigenes]
MDAINWEAYSHEELYRMLWQDADVADVSTVADEWTRHREALDTHAAVLKEQRAALLNDWQGAAAEEAAARLTKLAERIEKISEFSAAGEKAAQDAADALAAARVAMPPPPNDATMPAFAGLPSAPAPFAPAPFTLPSAPAPMTLPSAPTMPSGTTSGFYFYFGAASADQQKADAVRAMQTYESSLNGSGRLIDNAQGTIPQQAASPIRAPAAPSPVRTPSSGGVPWQRLVSGGSAGTTRGPVIGAAAPVSQQTQLSPGMRAGVMAGHGIGPMAMSSTVTESRSAAQGSGMAPGAGGARKDDDQEHENQMPTLDHGLFVVNDRVSPAVIGEEQ